MANKLPEQSRQGNVPPDAFELVKGSNARIKAKELHLGRKLEFFDKNGNFLAALRKNLPGNTPEERSYTLEFAGGAKSLIPVPHFCPLANLLIETFDNDDVEISIPQNITNLFYRFEEAGSEDISSIRPKVIEQKKLSAEWQEVPLKDDHCLVFQSADKQILARVFKVPHANEYILRSADGDAVRHYVEGTEEELASSSGKKLFMEVKKGKLMVRGEMDFVLNIESVGQIRKTEGGSGESFDETHPNIMRGIINGGRDAAFASYREIGKVKDALLYRNEDTGGFNTDTMVVADGLGGHYQGSQASDYAAECLLDDKGSFENAVDDTHEKMLTFTRFYSELIEQKKNDGTLEDDWFALPPIVPGKKKKMLSVPDTVMAAVRFEGDKLRTMILGDAKVYVVRGDEIVYRSREHSVVGQQLAAGALTKRQAMESEYRSTVSTTMVRSFMPDYDKFQLEAGDRIVVVSDGMDLPEKIIIESVKDKDAETGVINLLKEKRDENVNGGGSYDPGDGGDPVKLWSIDNGTVGVVVHD